MPLSRIAWLVLVVGLVIACVLLILAGYVGYAVVILAVAASAAINLV